jgi:hypothetical protein
MTLVSTGAGLDADGIVINPADYQAFRLMKDANNQYYGGGFFLPPYGEAGQTMAASQPLWGLRTVVTPAITAGTVLVGAFQQAATVYRKGGVRVESTNSHVDDFTNNLRRRRLPGTRSHPQLLRMARLAGDQREPHSRRVWHSKHGPAESSSLLGLELDERRRGS